MLDFHYYAPTYYEFGKDSECKVGELIQKFGGKRVLIHYGRNFVQKSGLLSRVKKYLDDGKISHKNFKDIISEIGIGNI